MLGIRVDRFLASTAVLLLLAGGGALADSITDHTIDAATATPDSPTMSAPATTTDTDKPAKPAAASDQPDVAAPAAAAPAATPQPNETATAPTATPQTTGTAAEPTAAPPPAGTAGEPTQSPATGPAPAAATAAAPGPELSAADAAIADQLRNLANGKFDNVIGKKDRTAIDGFYSGRNYAPIWITDGKINARGKAAIDYLGHVDADGLDPADYPRPNFDAASDPAALADAEIKLTTSVITFAHHASIGRVHWSRVSADIEFTTTAPEPTDVLAAIVAASDVGSALDAYEPHTPGYLALKAKLAEIRAGKSNQAKAPIPNGPLIKVGMHDDRVPDLRDRLGVSGDGTTYDKALAEAVKKYQQQHQIAATGVLNTATLDALNGPPPGHEVDTILANMERWRWMPHQFPDTYVLVNLPDFTLHVMHDGKEVWQTRIVIGKPEMPTPIMTAEMKFITINPTWNVPPSIVNREYLPALAQDPTVLERMGLRVSYNRDGSVHISQPPGDKNALGRIRFNFPNKFLVYQHDTPDKYMFAYDKRAFSHGCMRVQDPQRYAEVLLSLVRPDDNYTLDRIKSMIAEGSETDIQFPHFVPVNLTYQTAFVDQDGKLEFRDDVYGRDKTLLAILKSDERKVADTPIDHKEDASHREALAIPDSPSLFGGRGLFGGDSSYGRGGSSYYSGGDNFFSRLFGGFASAPPVPHRPIGHARKVTRRDTVER